MKLNDRVLFFIIIPAIIFMICLAIAIGIRYNLPPNTTLKCDPSYDGWNYFIELFNVPIGLLWKSLVAYGIFVATLKFFQSDRLFNKQMDYNQQIFEYTNRPYLSIDKLEYKCSDNTLKLNFELYNFGKFPIKLYRVYWELTKNTKRIDFQAKDLNYQTVYSEKAIPIESDPSKKPDIYTDDIFSINKSHTLILNMKILYIGIGKKIYTTTEKYIMEPRKTSFEPIDINYDFETEYSPEKRISFD